MAGEQTFRGFDNPFVTAYIDNPSNWHQFDPDPILLCLRWYLRFIVSDCNLPELLRERGLPVDPTTNNRWLQCDAPESEKRYWPHPGRTDKSDRIDETCVRMQRF